MPGIVLTPNLFNVFCNLLSSVEVVLCTAFFFLQYFQIISGRESSTTEAARSLRQVICMCADCTPSYGSFATGAHGTGHFHEPFPIHLQM